MVVVIIIICLLPDTLCTGTGEALMVSSVALMMVNRSNETEVFIFLIQSR